MQATCSRRWAGVLLIGILVLAPHLAPASVWASVRLRGGTIPDTTVGGAGEVSAQHDDEASVTDAYHTQTSGGDLTSDAGFGLLSGSIMASVEIPGSFSRLSPFASMYVQQQDTFTIGAGTSGLSNGDPVQVRIQAKLTGLIHLEGRPSGSTGLAFWVQGVPGVAGNWINWYSGSLSPPEEVEVDESWSIIADTTVGASFSLTSVLDGIHNGTAFDGPVSGGNNQNSTALIRVSKAPGYEKIVISSEAGASTLPLPPYVPASGPVGRVILAGALAVIGGTLVIRRMRTRGKR